MLGMDETNGSHKDGFSYLKQRVKNILSTPKGTRVMRRWYGSELFNLIDRPINGDLVADIYAACVTALFDFEAEFELLRVSVVSAKKSLIVLNLEGRYLANGEIVHIDNIEIKGK